jgi:hypothetical protein
MTNVRGVRAGRCAASEQVTCADLYPNLRGTRAPVLLFSLLFSLVLSNKQ